MTATITHPEAAHDGRVEPTRHGGGHGGGRGGRGDGHGGSGGDGNGSGRRSRRGRYRSGRPRRPAMRALWVAVSAVLVLVLTVLLAVPVRTWWTQRKALDDANATLTSLQEQNAALQDQIDAIKNDDAEIARQARELYGMVPPGVKAYAILPPPPPASFPTGWPYDSVRRLVTASALGN